MAYYSHLRTILIRSLLFVLALASARATTYIWYANDARPLNYSGGYWNPIGSSWFNPATSNFENWGNTGSDTAVFGIGSGADIGSVQVGTVNVNQMVFNPTGSVNYYLDYGTITLSGTKPTITANADATITSVIAGSAGLTKAGNNALILKSGNSTYTGATIISGGILDVSIIANGGTNSTLGSSTSEASNLIFNGGTLRVSNSTLGILSTDRLFSVGTSGGVIESSDTLTPLIFTNTGNMGFNGQAGARTLTLTGTNDGSFGANSLSVSISDNGGSTSLIKSGAGLWIINGTNTYSGATTIGSPELPWGTLQVGDGGTSGTLGTGTVINNAILAVKRSDTFVLANDISGQGALIQNGAGTTILTGNNTYLGMAYLKQGSLQIGNGGTSGTLGTGGLTFQNDSSSLIFNRSDELTISGGIQGNGTIIQAGSGITTVSGTSSYSFDGKIQITAGKLKIDTNFGGGTQQFNIANGATLSANGNRLYVASLSGSGTVENSGVKIATLDFGRATVSSIFSGIIQDGGIAALSLLKDGVSMLTLSGLNTYTGQTIIRGNGTPEGSILRATVLADGGHQSSIGASGSNPSNLLFGGGMLQYTGSSASTNRLFSLDTAYNRFFGGIDASGTGPISFTNAGNITFGQYVQYGSAGTFTLAGTNTDANTLTPALGNASSTALLTIWKTGGGTWVLAGNNSYSGATKVDNGILAAGSANAFGNNSVATVASGATLRLNSYSISLGALAGAGVVDNSNASSGTLKLGGLVGAYSFGGNLQDGTGTGSLNLVKNGLGTQTLSGINTYSGTTTINSGILQLAITDALYGSARGNWTAAHLIVNSGATAAFNVGGAGEFSSSDIAMLGNLGSATGGFLGGSNLGLDTSNALGGTFVHSSNLTDSNGGMNSIGLTKLGTGSLVLGGNNTYSGATAVISGVLIAGSSNAFGNNSKTSLGVGTTLRLNGNNIGLGSLSGAGSIDNSSAIPTTLTVGGNNLSSGYYGNIKDGTGGGSLGVTKVGTGKLTLSGQNIYSGPTIIQEGSVAFEAPNTFYNNDNAKWTAENLTVKGGGTAIFGVGAPGSGYFSAASIASIAALGTNTGGFQNGSLLGLDTTNSAYSGPFVISSNLTNTNNGLNSIGLNKLGNGTLILSGNNTYTGPTIVSGGILTITGSITSPVSVSNGAQLIINSATPFSQNITFSNTSRTVLSGNATIASSISLNNQQNTLSPGNSPGSLVFTANQSWNSFTYDWQTNNFTGTTPGIHFDQIVVTGSLVLSGGTGSYILNVLSLTSGNVSGSVPNFSESSMVWDIITTTSGITGFNPNAWIIDTSSFTHTNKPSFILTPDFMGNFSLLQSGNNLSLIYTPIGAPEPSGAILVMIAFMWSISRRNK